MPEAVFWYVVQSEARRERAAVKALVELFKSLDEPVDAAAVYLPCETRKVRYGRSTAPAQCPLFPGYLFAQVPGEAFCAMRGVDGVKAVLSTQGPAGPPQPMPRGMVEAILAAEAEGLFDRTRRPDAYRPQVGEKVTMTEGPFSGFVAKVVKASPGAARIRVLWSRWGEQEVDIAKLRAA